MTDDRVASYSITTHYEQNIANHNVGTVNLVSHVSCVMTGQTKFCAGPFRLWEPSVPGSSKPFTRGLEYVAISRYPAYDKLYLLKPLQPKHFNSFPTPMKHIRECYDKFRGNFQ